MNNLDLGLIGNCQISALIDKQATVVWACLPQLDSDPMFCKLLRADEDRDLPGEFGVEMADFSHSEQQYLTNTAILSTTMYDKNGGALEVTDLIPRYKYVGRMFAPMMIARRVRPLSGSPRIRLKLRPAKNYGAAAPDHECVADAYRRRECVRARPRDPPDPRTERDDPRVLR